MSRRVPASSRPMGLEDLVKYAIGKNLKESDGYEPVIVEWLAERKAEYLMEDICIQACERGKGEFFNPDCEFYEFKLDAKKMNIDKWNFKRLYMCAEELFSAKQEFKEEMQNCGKAIGDVVYETEEFKRFHAQYTAKEMAREAKREAKKKAREVYEAKMKEAGYGKEPSGNPEGSGSDDEEDESEDSSSND